MCKFKNLARVTARVMSVEMGVQAAVTTHLYGNTKKMKQKQSGSTLPELWQKVKGLQQPRGCLIKKKANENH